ncbi:RING finger protein 148 [Myxocyprinus asiaticus]|uniref:RING finger protein 148 n=1 Tax=Myxocyprinus asiaticus TaxID=70543 RepID=UPI002221DB1F|nr:RING finger protein 148 [Myxocyprinus asiaticus]
MPSMELRRMSSSSCVWLPVLVLQCCFQLSASLIYWSAYVELRYLDRWTNETVGSMCECGVFGAHSLLESASGGIVLPNADPLACSRNTTFTAPHEPWIALIKKGNCTYTRKILAARRNGASAVVIYNIDGTGNNTNIMSHPDADGVVAIMIGNIQGTEITNLIKSGTYVYMKITVANPYGLWSGATWAYALSFAFIGITAITLFYFAFLFIKRMYRNQQLRMQLREMKRVAESAIAQLEVRTLRRGDPEVDSEDTSCAVCTDSFQHNEKVTVLPCRHLYHKKCIEPWLLEHPTCPICKYNILKSKMDEESSEQRSSSDVSFCPPVVMTVTSTHQRHTSDVQTAENHVYCEMGVQTQHIYENPAFEDEPQTLEHHNINNQM